jgi:hypothetical protein
VLIDLGRTKPFTACEQMRRPRSVSASGSKSSCYRWRALPRVPR